LTEIASYNPFHQYSGPKHPIISFAAPLTLNYQISKLHLQPICKPLFGSKQTPFQIRMNRISTTITLGMEQAKKFLKENPTESRAVAARIFNVNVKTLTAFIQRGLGKKNEGHNKVLQDHEINALDDFIRSLLRHEISSISQLVFSAIVGLKRAHHCEASSKR
jgi:hypothetical protein